MEMHFELNPSRKFLRALSACCAVLCVAAQPGGALAHSVVVLDTAWQASGTGRVVLATLGERWVLATNSPRRAAGSDKNDAPGAATPPSAARPLSRLAAARAGTNVVTVPATGPGQSGYVHYFLIEDPDGEREIQVGIGLPDGRIAWSFPELGVVVSPFMESGKMQAGARAYSVQHLYGIRPFRDDGAMLALRKDLWKRVIPWVEDATPYCYLAVPGNPPCLSCLDFVLRVLYPSRSGGMPALPPDFVQSGAGLYFTTEDLLLYQAGLGGRSKSERVARIDALTLPSNLRDDLIQIVRSIEPDDSAALAAAPKKATARKRPPVRSISKAGQVHPSSPKKL